jgi:hypothetical protein
MYIALTHQLAEMLEMTLSKIDFTYADHVCKVAHFPS